ncbi:MAG: hypothetical protein AW07_00913 [Candidatus Accumulibacter sp. SK-11]|nr:MAG: hypothetical protein AW07_00913 [Candidatus Accumulibacter sp. SK-11]
MPRLLGDENRRRVVAETAADEIETGESDNVLVGGVAPHRRLDLLDDARRALERRAVGQDDGTDVEALVLVGHQAAGSRQPEQAGDDDHAGVDREHQRRAPDDPDDAIDVAAGEARKPVVEGAEEAVRRPLAVLQHDHAQRRREGQRNEPGENDRDREGHRELPVEFPGQPAEEGDRHEDRGQREDDRDHRAAHLAHRLQRRRTWRQTLLAHDALDVLEDDDGVVDDDADRQHHAEEGQRVDRVAEEVDAGEGAEQRHRHRGERNDRRPPALQEEIDDEEDEQHRLGQRLQNFLDRHADEARRVVGNGVAESLGEAWLQLVERLQDALRDRERVGAGRQEDADERRRLAVVAAVELVVARTEFDARDIAETDTRAVRIGANDDRGELRGVGEAPLRGDRVDQILSLADWRLADLAGGELCVLLVDRPRHVAGSQLQLRQSVRLQPDAHGVVLGAEDLHVGRPRQPLQAVEDVQRHVVRGEEVVVAAVGSIEGEHLQERR